MDKTKAMLMDIHNIILLINIEKKCHYILFLILFNTKHISSFLSYEKFKLAVTSVQREMFL